MIRASQRLNLGAKLKKLSRTPPTHIRKSLRAEVGFGCPVDGCDIPYLEYHHFDPPWHTENHHRKHGMIALCSVHHAKADAWTVEQVRKLKSKPHHPNREIRNRFEWMRHQVLAIAGGNYYLDCPTVLELNGKPVIWYNRDEQGHALLNVQMPSVNGDWSHLLEDNDWHIEGKPIDVECPPSGNVLDIKYEDGRAVRVKFQEWSLPSLLFAKHPATKSLESDLVFPLLTVEIHCQIPSWEISLRPKATEIETNSIRGSVMRGCEVGVSFVGSPTVKGILDGYSHLFTK